MIRTTAFLNYRDFLLTFQAKGDKHNLSPTVSQREAQRVAVWARMAGKLSTALVDLFNQIQEKWKD